MEHRLVEFTMQIDEFCERYIIDTLKAVPGSKGQYDYPYTVNTSLNHVICHGMPSSKQILKKAMPFGKIPMNFFFFMVRSYVRKFY